MKPTKELIKELTQIQRDLVIKMQKEGVLVCPHYDKGYLFRRLEELGIFVRTSRPGAGSHTYVLSPDWENVDVNIPQRVRKRDVPPIEDGRPVIPDPPKKKLTRPPAVYSNRSNEELIDHILKNY